MPKPPPLPRYVPKKQAPEQSGPGVPVPVTDLKDGGASLQAEQEKISEEDQVIDPLLIKAIQAGGVTIGSGSGGGHGNEAVEVPPEVTIRPGKKGPIEGPFLDPDGSVSFGERQGMERSTEELLDQPSLLELYRERLIQEYDFTEKDPAFALLEIYSEAERRDLARNMATERACERMLVQTEHALSIIENNVVRLEGGFGELEILEQSVESLQAAADSLEAIVIQQQEDLQSRLKALDLLQKDLTRDVNNALQRRVVDRLLVLVTVCCGIVIGSNLHWFFAR